MKFQLKFQKEWKSMPKIPKEWKFMPKFRKEWKFMPKILSNSRLVHPFPESRTPWVKFRRCTFHNLRDYVSSVKRVLPEENRSNWKYLFTRPRTLFTRFTRTDPVVPKAECKRGQSKTLICLKRKSFSRAVSVCEILRDVCWTFFSVRFTIFRVPNLRTHFQLPSRFEMLTVSRQFSCELDTYVSSLLTMRLNL